MNLEGLSPAFAHESKAVGSCTWTWVGILVGAILIISSFTEAVVYFLLIATRVLCLRFRVVGREAPVVVRCCNRHKCTPQQQRDLSKGCLRPSLRLLIIFCDVVVVGRPVLRGKQD